MLPERVVVTIPIITLLKALMLSPLVVLIGWWVFTWSWESQAAPAWVQAVGSIGAILAAGAVPAWQRRLEGLRREADQYQRQIADCFQLRRLIQEIQHLLTKGDQVNPSWFGRNRALVETGMLDILQRLSSLESGRSDKFLLKSTYDVRLIVLDFLGSISPSDACSVNVRRGFEERLVEIHNDIPGYILSLEKIIKEIDAEVK